MAPVQSHRRPFLANPPCIAPHVQSPCDSSPQTPTTGPDAPSNNREELVSLLRDLLWKVYYNLCLWAAFGSGSDSDRGLRGLQHTPAISRYSPLTPDLLYHTMYIYTITHCIILYYTVSYYTILYYNLIWYIIKSYHIIPAACGRTFAPGLHEVQAAAPLHQLLASLASAPSPCNPGNHLIVACLNMC